MKQDYAIRRRWRFENIEVPISKDEPLTFAEQVNASTLAYFGFTARPTHRTESVLVHEETYIDFFSKKCLEHLSETPITMSELRNKINRDVNNGCSNCNRISLAMTRLNKLGLVLKHGYSNATAEWSLPKLAPTTKLKKPKMPKRNAKNYRAAMQIFWRDLERYYQSVMIRDIQELSPTKIRNKYLLQHIK